MVILQSGERKEFSLVKEKISGFSFCVTMSSMLVNVQPTSIDCDFTKALFKVILKRDGKQFVLVQDDLKVLGLESNIYTYARRAFYQDHSHNLLMITADATTKGQSILVFDVDLKGTLDIKGTDELLVELNLQAGVFSANIDPAQAYVQVKPVKSVGFEKYVPYIRSYSIQANERRRQFDLGNSVISAVLLNYDRGYSASPVVTSVILSSKQFSDSLSYIDLLNQKYVNRLDVGGAVGISVNNEDEYDQSFVLFDNIELDEVNIDISFEATNVAANKNLLVVHSAYTDVKTLIEHDANVVKAQNEKIAELKQNGENAKIA